MSGRYLELLRGIPTLRALGRVERGRDEVVAANEAVSASVDATLRAAMLSSAALEFLAGRRRRASWPCGRPAASSTAPSRSTPRWP